MNKKKIFKKVTSITSIGVIGTTVGIVTTSCGSKPIPPAPVIEPKSEDGTDWDHKSDTLISGRVLLSDWKTAEEIGEEYGTCSIVGNDNYAAEDLVIPEFVRHDAEDGDNKIYRITAITGPSESEGAFQKCKGLTGSLTISNSVETIGDYAFWSCSNFNGNLIIGEGVKSIGDWTFRSCEFTGSLTIGESVETIGDYAFYNCGFTGNLEIPDSVSTIGESAFEGCGFNGNLIISEGVEIIGNAAFYSCRFTGSLEIPDSVTTIGANAFQDCTDLTSITIPNSVTWIGDYAFIRCNQLLSITLNGFTNCDWNWSGNAFWGMRSWGVITPTGTVYVENSTTITPTQACGKLWFENGLKTDSGAWSPMPLVDVKNDVGTDWNHKSDTNISGTVELGGWTGPTSGEEYGTCSIIDNNGYIAEDLVIPELIYHKDTNPSLSGFYKITEIGNDAFYSSSGLTGSLTISDSVETIGNSAFKYCDRLTGSLTINNGVKTIESNAFYGCTNFTGGLKIGESVETIGVGAFLNCKKFTGSLEIGESVEIIENETFYGCEGLTSVVIPNSVTSIGKDAFAGCISLTNVTIPDSVTSIGDSIFVGCDSLVSITLSGFETLTDKPPNWSSSSFYQINSQGGFVYVAGERTMTSDNALAILTLCGISEQWKAAPTI